MTGEGNTPGPKAPVTVSEKPGPKARATGKGTPGPKALVTVSEKSGPKAQAHGLCFQRVLKSLA